MEDVENTNVGDWRGVLLAVAVAIGLTFVFWLPLYQDHGFVGGDVYSYYLPQKDVLAESLQAGELPLWNHRTGWGYPLIAESQSGALYPPTLVCYRFFNLNTAYNANHLLHYVFAFVFMWLYGRRLGLQTFPSLLAATIYVYGWFPPRCSLEWAIIGGTWLPAALLATESFLQSRSKRCLIGLAAAISLQMLAGHFLLAFITLLLLPLYVVLRIWFGSERVHQVESSDQRSSRFSLAAWVMVPIAASFLLAAVQLLPTWELKTSSQRAMVTEEHDPEYGHMPPMYVTQLVASWWFWYAEDVNTDQAVKDMEFLASDADTNSIDAHMYFGLIPVLLLIIALFRGHVFSGHLERVWAILGLLFLAYAPGWFVPMTQHLPGFSFFKGPGRYTIVTTLAAALVSAFVMNRLVLKKRVLGSVLCIAIIAITVVEFRIVAEQIGNAVMVETPPISQRDDSSVRQYFADKEANVRLYAQGANLPNLCGVAALPVYLGLSPDEYFNPQLMTADNLPVQADETTKWLQAAGVTHVLWQDPISSTELKLVSNQPDVFLNRAWGRPANSPMYLYTVSNTRPRAYCETGSVDVVKLEPNKVELQANLTEAGRVVLTDLMSPGWSVTIDGTPAVPIPKAPEPKTPEGVFRVLDVPAGQHTIEWTYAPRTVSIGAVVSGMSWLILIVLFFVRRSKSPSGVKL
ncbi:MAG: hypothetical protein AB8G99_25950 [Planctomycetaceae bacterium]